MTIFRRRWAATGLLLGLLASACTPAAPPLPDATATAEALAQSLVTGDLSGVSFDQAADAVAKDYGIVTQGLGGLHPATVEVAGVTYETATQAATVQLSQTYNVGKPWQFTSTALLQYAGSDGWQVVWSPSIVQPALDGYTRLTLSRTAATRGQILARDGSAIVWNRPIYKVGIDKAKVSADQAVTSARALAELLGIDADAYAKRVASGGPKQFVIALTVRAGQVPPELDSIPGGYAQAGTLSLGPSSTFAIGLLGGAGEVTAEDIEKSGGVLREGDIVGKTGLQASQDAALRGHDGYTIYLAPRAADDVIVPSPSARPTASSATDKTVLFQSDPVTGVDLQTTLDVALQTKAENILAGQNEIAALVVLDSQTGALLVAANSPAAGANPYATTGRYAPGSSFKIVTALALLRSGMTPDSTIQCPTAVTVNGMQFTNMDGYPSSHNGNITLRQAIAWSCNTAMVNGALTLGPDALADAAASLGIGIDHDVGFSAFFGSVPVPSQDVDKAAASFGQGTVLASPLAMAAEAASVAAGQTITPYLLVDAATGQPWQPPATSPGPSVTPGGSSGTAGETAASPDASGEPSPSPSPAESSTTPSPSRTATPLTPAEADALRDMMAAVVNVGTASSLRGLALGAKTGTAEFVQDGQELTHAWMIAYTGQYAIAAYVHIGESGNGTAGPLIKAFLS